MNDQPAEPRMPDALLSVREMQRRAKQGTLHPIAKLTMDRVDPDWMLSPRERKWRAKLAGALTFREANAKRWAKGDWGPDGRWISVWLTTHRLPNADARHVRELDRVMPEWRNLGRANAVRVEFNDRVMSLKDFTDAHGRLPSAGSEDQAESSLGNWLLKKARHSTPAERATLNAYFEGWDLTARERLWRQRLSEVREFHTVTGRWPSKSAKDKVERALSSWLTTQLAATDERKAILDRKLPGWAQRNANDTWTSHLANAVEWFSEHPDSHPKSTANDLAERRVRQWIENQKANATPERLAELDRALPSWRGRTGDEVWRDNLTAVQAWVAEHGRMPAQSVKPEGQWLAVQRRPTTKAARQETLDRELPGWR